MRWKTLAEIYTMHSFAPFSWDPSGRINKSLHACRLRLRTKANRCNHGHSTSRISEVIDTQHHVSLRYSKRSLCAVCRRIFPGTRSVRGGKMRRAAKSPKRPKIFFQNSLGANRKQENRIWAPDTPIGCKTPEKTMKIRIKTRNINKQAEHSFLTENQVYNAITWNMF